MHSDDILRNHIQNSHALYDCSMAIRNFLWRLLQQIILWQFPACCWICNHIMLPKLQRSLTKFAISPQADWPSRNSRIMSPVEPMNIRFMRLHTYSFLVCSFLNYMILYTYFTSLTPLHLWRFSLPVKPVNTTSEQNKLDFSSSG